jgi:hypothetical protein
VQKDPVCGMMVDEKKVKLSLDKYKRSILERSISPIPGSICPDDHALEQVVGKVATPRVVEWMEKLKNEPHGA